MQGTLAPADAALEPLTHFDGARDALRPRARLEEVRRRARAFREQMLAGPQALYYRSFGLVRVPYPTRYGLRDATTVKTPFMHILNRLFVVQFQGLDGALKTLLASPSDVDANRETPFFKRLERRSRWLGPVGPRLLAPRLKTVEGCLEEVGLRPEQVDYISYDHLHTQDVRRWLGSHGQPGLFPKAKLLVTRQEWEAAHGLLPREAQWYCPQGVDGVDSAKVVLLDSDVRLGDGVAIVRTPGHTEGNHSFVVHTPEGLMVTSENGVGPDAYAPERSRIPGVARYARDTGAEVVLNGNSLEDSVDQYLSMVQEKEIAGPSARNPDFPNVVTSSELTGYWAFPGLTPTFGFGDLELGRPRTS